MPEIHQLFILLDDGSIVPFDGNKITAGNVKIPINPDPAMKPATVAVVMGSGISVSIDPAKLQ